MFFPCPFQLCKLFGLHYVACLIRYLISLSFWSFTISCVQLVDMKSLINHPAHECLPDFLSTYCFEWFYSFMWCFSMKLMDLVHSYVHPTNTYLALLCAGHCSRYWAPSYWLEAKLSISVILINVGFFLMSLNLNYWLILIYFTINRKKNKHANTIKNVSENAFEGNQFWKICHIKCCWVGLLLPSKALKKQNLHESTKEYDHHQVSWSLKSFPILKFCLNFFVPFFSCINRIVVTFNLPTRQELWWLLDPDG